MPDYAIGDIQGCYDTLQKLLEKIDFNEHDDRLWFVGDLVNRGPQSLAVLEFIKQLPTKPYITLGNHDLHLLARIFSSASRKNHDDTLEEILKTPHVEEIGQWLRQQSILHHDPALKVTMSHAGIAPIWDLSQAQAFAHELECVLQGDHFQIFLTHMYGNEPNYWSPSLQGVERLRVICNYFTRMRFCDRRGHLMLHYKGALANAPEHLFPWFALPGRIALDTDLIFGHWAALMGKIAHSRIYPLDTGCVWGGNLTALRLQDKKLFSVVCADI